MKIYASMPRQIVHGWVESDEVLEAKGQAGYHYHDVEEWLEVTSGDITFFTLTNQPCKPAVNQALQIPRGEVHRVEAGSKDVKYRMWVPKPGPLPDPGGNFAKTLHAEQVELLRDNLRFPYREDNADRAFFERILSKDLTFCTAAGQILQGKEAFFERGFERSDRRSCGSARVLNRTTDSLLLSTVVIVAGGGGPPKSYTNVRHFIQEEGRPKCRLWANYPEFGPPEEEVSEKEIPKKVEEEPA